MNDQELAQAVQHQQDRLTKLIEQSSEMIASINFLEELLGQAEAGLLTLDALEHSCHVFADSGQGYQPWIDKINHFCKEAHTWPQPTAESDLQEGSPYFEKLQTLLAGLAAEFEEQ